MKKMFYLAILALFPFASSSAQVTVEFNMTDFSDSQFYSDENSDENTDCYAQTKNRVSLKVTADYCANFEDSYLSAKSPDTQLIAITVSLTSSNYKINTIDYYWTGAVNKTFTSENTLTKKFYATQPEGYNDSYQSGVSRFASESGVSQVILSGNTNKNGIGLVKIVVNYSEMKLNLELKDSEPYQYSQNGVQASSISYSREMGNQWGTICLPFAAPQDGETNYTLYTIDDEEGFSNGVISLNKVEGSLPAGTPAIICRNPEVTTIEIVAPAKADGSLYYAIAEPKDDDPMMGGTFVGTTEHNVYFIAKNQFWASHDNEKGVYLGPYRAWIKDFESASRPRQLGILDPDSNESTSIQLNEALNTLNDASVEYYDATGKKVEGPQKGLNIVKAGDKVKKIYIK